VTILLFNLYHSDGTVEQTQPLHHTDYFISFHFIQNMQNTKWNLTIWNVERGQNTKQWDHKNHSEREREREIERGNVMKK